MKHVQRMGSTSQSCSCTSCLYKSESDRSSIRKYIKHGSGIDRLYYGKYIPLRERKLLNKLVRTRAVYDDLRARLISDSTLSLEKNADLTPGKHHKFIKTPDSKQSGAVLELVDLIDKGGALESKDPSECCSCCSCTSEILERGKKEHRTKRAFAQTYEPKPVMGDAVYARAYERENGTVSGTIGERYNKRAVRFKPKRIKSEPCTCTLKFSGLIKKHSKIQQTMLEKPERQSFARKSYQNYLKVQKKLHHDIRKLNESRTNLTRHFQVRTKKSLEKLKNNVQSGIRKSIQKIKTVHPKDKAFNISEYPETTFKIKKDSIAKFKDYLKRKNKMKDWECDLGCDPDTCVPEECFKIIKLRKLHKYNRQRDDVKVGTTQFSKSNSSVQANRRISIPKQKPRMRRQTSRSSQIGIHLQAPKHKQGYQRDSESHIASNSLVASSQETHENLRNQTPVKHRPGRRAYIQAKTTLRKCFCTFKLQANKVNKKTKTSKTGTEISPETNKAVLSMTDRYAETKNNNDYETPILYNLLPYQCEPGVCVPGECDPILCKKILDLRNKRGKSKSTSSSTDSYKTKSTSSIISKHFKSPKAKLVPSSIAPTKTGNITPSRKNKDNLNMDREDLIKTSTNEPQRQAVRIGSSFSFNIDFYKEQKPDTETLSGMPLKSYQKRQKDMDTSKGSSLRKYLWNGSVKKLKQNKKHTQTLQEASIEEWVVNRGTKTKKEHRYKLLPFECEPYFCVPGKCDPYICLQKIKRRDMNMRNISTLTEKSKKRSISNFTERSFKKSKAVLVHRKKFRKGRSMNADYFKLEETVMPSKAKQAVRIGSNFSFTIEFSKQKSGTVTLPRKKKRSSKLYPKLNNGKDVTITKVSRVSRASTQASTHKRPKVNRASLVRPLLKRCFCTLNLQKSSKQHYRKDLVPRDKYLFPNDYTIYRATNTKTNIISTFGSHINNKFNFARPESEIISMSTSSSLLNKHIKSLGSTYEIVNHYSTFKLPIQSKRPIIVKSNLSMKIDVIRQLKDSQILKSSCCLSLDEKFHERSLLSINQKHDQSFKKLTSISRFLERCFCTMNVQVSNKGDGLKAKRIGNKLKPYECEPGICIPGDCDPYECKKLIMQRLTKNVSSGTIVNKPVSNFASTYSQIDPGGPEKQTKREKKLQVDQKLHKKYEPLRKYHSQPFEKYVGYNETNTQIKKPVTPIVISVHRGHTDRCFCTLKLRKKGRIPMEYINKEETNTQIRKSTNGNTYKSVNIGTQGNKHKYTASMMNRIQLQKKGRIRRKYTTLNMSPLKKQLSSRESLPIKETLSLREKSHKTSKTQVKQKYKKRAVEAISERKHHKATKPVKYIKSVENVNSHIAGTTSSRQAVRINSNFSFNIEFHKHIPQVEDTKLGRVKIPSNDSKPSKDRQEIKTIYSPTAKHRKEIKTSYFPSTKSVSKVTETEKQFIQRPKTTTSYVKRSFNKIPEHRKKQTFRQKCLCLIGLRSKGHKENVPYLEPYECEPGICVPGQCNPYLCEKVLQQRTIKQYSRKFENEPLRTQSISSRYRQRLKPLKNESTEETSKKYTLPSYEVDTNMKRMKSVKTQSNTRFKRKLLTDLSVNGRSDIEQQFLQRINKRHQLTKESGTVTKYPKTKSFGNASNIDTKDENSLVKPPIMITKRAVQNANVNKTTAVESFNKQRQAVRIGSNFSFNIEVFREIENDSPRIVKTRPREEFNIQKTYKNISQRHVKTQQSDFNPDINSELISRKQQSNLKYLKQQSNISIRDFLKKCICAFKRNKVNKYGVKGTSTHSRRIPQSLIKESIRTLHPYECEPYTCIPGECNPYQCLKRIQQRQFRDYGTNYKRNVKNFGTDSIKQPVYKSTTVQYERKRNSRGTSLTSKRTRLNKKRNQFPPLIYPNTDSQAVRIGSNFSFNVEFFKGDVTQNTEYNDNKGIRRSEELQLKQRENQWTKYKGTASTVKRRCNKYCQFSEAKRQVMHPLSKKMDHPKSEGKLLSSIVTKDKTTTTKLKYTNPRDMSVYECPPHMCIPGQCNLNKCLEKIKARGYIRKSVNNLRTHKVQSPIPKRRNVVVSTHNFELQSEILKSSQKRKSEPAVVSFLKIKGKDNEESRNVITYTNKNRGDIKLKEHVSDTADLQKRCFCTLQLQKPKIARVEMNPGNHVQYPQTFTVGRVVVEPFINPYTNINSSNKTDVTKATHIDPKLLKRTVGTKVNKNYFRNTVQCDPSVCSKFSKKIFRRKTQGDMRAILSSTSRKLTANKSNKQVPTNSFDTKSNLNESFFCRCSRIFSRRSKILDKQSKNGQQPVGIKLLLAQKNVKNFDKDCPFICPDNTKTNIPQRGTKSEYPPMKTTFPDKQNPARNAIPKRERNKINSASRSTVNSVVLNDCPTEKKMKGHKKAVASSESADDCNYCKSCKTKINTQEISKGGGDGRLGAMLSRRQISEAGQPSQKYDVKRQSLQKAPIDDNTIEKLNSAKQNTLIKPPKATKGASESLRKTPKNPIKSQKAAKDDSQSLRKTPKDLVKSQKAAKGANQYLPKTLKDLINSKKAAKGDSQSLRKTPKYFVKSPQEAAKGANQYIPKTLKDFIKSQKAAKDASQPLRKAPKDLIKTQKVAKGASPFFWKTEGPKDVKNTKDKVKSPKKNILIQSQKATEGAQRALNTFGNFLPAKDMLLSVNPLQLRRPRPCICGSKACKKKLSKEQKNITVPNFLQRNKVCVCGSSICTKVSKKTKQKPERKAVQQSAKPKVNTYVRKPLRERIQIAKNKDEMRRLQRIKRNRELEKQVKKYKNASDLTLAVESLIDIGRLGGSTVTDALRYSTRAYTDPLVARETICKVGRRRRRWCWNRAARDDALASDIYSTYRRIKTRCSFMDLFRYLKMKLESYPFTHFLLHIRDKNAKKHKYEYKEPPQKRAPKRAGFQCNVYMATLRKKPFISLYYKYPRLYPHFLSLLSIWRQLTNIVFFVLAAVIWTPCILSVEVCRAMMCCFFCTG